MMLLGTLILGRPPFVFVDGLAKSTPAEASLFGSGYAGLGINARTNCMSIRRIDSQSTAVVVPSGLFSSAPPTGRARGFPLLWLATLSHQDCRVAPRFG